MHTGNSLTKTAFLETHAQRHGMAAPPCRRRDLEVLAKVIVDRNWCLIGGCAIALHLQMSACNRDISAYRASPDIDIMGTCLPQKPLIRIAPLIFAGWGCEYHHEDQVFEIDWHITSKMNTLRRISEIGIQRRVSIRGIPVMLPVHLVALKLGMQDKAWRPKDFTDVRLLLAYSGITVAEIECVLNEHMDRASAMSSIQRLARITAKSALRAA